MQLKEPYLLDECLVNRFMSHGSNRVYGVPLLVLVLRTSLGRFRLVNVFPVLMFFVLGYWGGRSCSFAFISIFVCAFVTLLPSIKQCFFLPHAYRFVYG